MKQLILTVILATLSASTCLGEWIEVSKGESENTFYVDFDRIKEHGGHVYYWYLGDFPNSLMPVRNSEILSFESYTQGDCNLSRWKVLAGNSYSQPMGKGAALHSSDEPDENWTYPSPVLDPPTGQNILKAVCGYVEGQ
jgi:hypothetical protein